MLWNDAYLAEHGHIVGIAIPAWHYMHVEMLSDTGSGGTTVGDASFSGGSGGTVNVGGSLGGNANRRSIPPQRGR